MQPHAGKRFRHRQNDDVHARYSRGHGKGDVLSEQGIREEVDQGRANARDDEGHAVGAEPGAGVGPMHRRRHDLTACVDDAQEKPEGEVGYMEKDYRGDERHADEDGHKCQQRHRNCRVFSYRAVDLGRAR